MTYSHHPVFGAISADRRDLDPAVRTLEAKLHDIGESHAEASRRKREAEIDLLERALDTIDTDAPLDLSLAPIRAHFRQSGPIADECETPLQDTEWQDREGRIWDVKVRPRPVEPATPSAETYAPPAPQPSAPQPQSRYDRAFIANREAQKAFEECLRNHGPADPRTTSAADTLAKSRVRFDKEKARAKQDVSRLQDAIDLHRKTPGGRDARNAKRRNRPVPNANRASMTDEARKEHDREMERMKKQRQRAAKKAEATQEGK